MLALTEIFHDDQEQVSQRGNLTASAKKEKSYANSNNNNNNNNAIINSSNTWKIKVVENYYELKTPTSVERVLPQYQQKYKLLFFHLFKKLFLRCVQKNKNKNIDSV